MSSYVFPDALFSQAIFSLCGLLDMNKTTYISFSLLAAMVITSSSAFAQDVVETTTQVFRGKVTKADSETVTVEMVIQGRPQEITVPRNIVRRLTVEPPPSVVTGIQAYEEGDWRKAKLNLERVILNFQGLDVEWAQKGMVYFGRSCLRSGDYDNAERAFDSFINAYPEHDLVIEARLGKAEIERARKNYENALEMFREIVEPFDGELRPEAGELLYAAECYIGIGKCLEAQGDDAGALTAYVRVIALYPVGRFYPEALYLCAALFNRIDRLEKAEQYLTELINDHASSEFARSAIQLRDAVRQKKRAADNKAG